MKKTLVALAVVLCFAANATGSIKPADPEANWAVIIGAAESAGALGPLQAALRRLESTIRANYDLPIDHVIEVFPDISASAVTQAFERIARQRALRTTVLIYAAAPIVAQTHGDARELYLVPADVRPSETWNLTPLSRVLKPLPRDASVLLVLADCLDEESRNSKHLLDASPTDMPRLDIISTCPRGVDFLFPTNRLNTVLLQSGEPKLRSIDVAKRLHMPNRPVYLLQVPPGAETTFALRHRAVDKLQPVLAAWQAASTPDEKTKALQDLGSTLAQEKSSQAPSRDRAAQTLLDVARGPESAELRYTAINALGRAGVSQAVPDLMRIAAQSDENPTLRAAAIDALDKLPVPDRLPYINAGLDAANARVRIAAIRSARNSRDERVAEKIAEHVVSDADDEVRIAALQAISDFPVGGELARKVVRGAMESGPSPAVRSEAVLTWARMQQPLTEPFVAQLLEKDADTSVRETIALSLGNSAINEEQRPAAELMLTAAARPEMPAEVRRAAMRSWKRVDGAHAEAALIAALSDPDEGVKLAAIAGLTSSATAVQPLIALAAPSTSMPVRRAAINALGEIGDPAALGVLRLALKDEDVALREEALKALANVNAVTTEGELLERMRDRVAEVRAQAVSQVNDQNATPELIRAAVERLGDDDLNVVRAAADALSALRNPFVVDVVSGALNKEAFQQRAAAAEVLGRIGNAAAAVPLRRFRFDPNPLVRSAVVTALGRLPTREEDLSLFLTSGRDSDIAVRLAAVESLKLVPEPRAQAMLKVLANDEAASVRQAAALALGVK